jgi:AraC-like DNA-binding protein
MFIFFLGKGFMNNLDQYKNEILSQYQQGGSILGLSKSYECNYRTMKKFLKANGVETRGLSGNGKMEKYKDRIFELYNQGLACHSIGKEVGFDRHLVQKFLERHGVNYESRKPNRAGKDKELMLKLHEEGKNSAEIAKELGYSRSFVRRYLEQFGCKFERDLYNVDEDFFKKIDTEIKSYILGWWFTDGGVTKNRICLKITDLDILERIREEMKYEGPLLSNRPKPTHHKLAHILSISRTEMANDLIALGCGINKTFNVKFPSTDIVPDHLVRHL